MKRLDWAELEGEGGKIQRFARVFVNEMIVHNLKWQEMPSKSNEVNLKVKSHPFIKGVFHAVNENGNLYYNAFVKDNNMLFFEILGIEMLIGLLSFLIHPFLAIFLLTGFPLLYLWIGGISLGIANKSKKEACPIALKTAEAEIRSI